MGGFSAISEADGWLISGLGIAVVFSGLAGLAILISNFPRTLAWWNRQSLERVGTHVKDLLRPQEVKNAVPSVSADVVETGGIDDAEAVLRMLTSFLGEPFKLPRVLELAKDRLHKPHSTVNSLLRKGTIVAGRDGLFHWKNGGEGGESPHSEETAK